MSLEFGGEIVDRGAVAPVGGIAVEIHVDALAEAAGQQLADRNPEDLPGQVPQGDVDAAHGRNVRLVGVLQPHHPVVELVDVERVGPEEHLAGEPFEVRPAHRTAQSRFADTVQAAIGVDAHQALPGGILELHGGDAGDAHASAFVFGTFVECGHNQLSPGFPCSLFRGFRDSSLPGRVNRTVPSPLRDGRSGRAGLLPLRAGSAAGSTRGRCSPACARAVWCR